MLTFELLAIVAKLQEHQTVSKHCSRQRSECSSFYEPIALWDISVPEDLAHLWRLVR